MCQHIGFPIECIFTHVSNTCILRVLCVLLVCLMHVFLHVTYVSYTCLMQIVVTAKITARVTARVYDKVQGP